MKHFFVKMSATVLVVLALFSANSRVLAADTNDPFGIGTSAPEVLKKGIANKNSVPEVVGTLIQGALSVIGIIFFVLVLYAGFSWMIARGNSEQVEKSKSIIEGAVIGLVIVTAAYAITNFVFTSLDKGVVAPDSGQAAESKDSGCAATFSGGECVQNAAACTAKGANFTSVTGTSCKDSYVCCYKP